MMSKAKKIWLLVAAALVLAGLIVFGGVMSILKWDFTKLSTVNFETHEYTVEEEIRDVRLSTRTANVKFCESEGTEVSVVCVDQKKLEHTVMVQDGTLIIQLEDTRRWYDHISIMSGTGEITVFLPAGQLGRLTLTASTADVDIPDSFEFESVDISVSTGDVTLGADARRSVKISTNTGDITLDGVSTGSLELSVNTGKILATAVECRGDATISTDTGNVTIQDTTCNSLEIDGDTSKVTLKNVFATEVFDIETDTGAVLLDRCDAAGLYVKTSTGDVRGTLLTDKIFYTDTSTGHISVPRSTSGGICDVTTSTGDIQFEIIQ